MDSDSKKNIWDLKPFWCQPWSIITFGALVLVFSWILLNKIQLIIKTKFPKEIIDHG